jgi:type II secretory pathway component GspD/PulD (secretin)
VTDSSVKGTITVRLLDLTCDEAFRYILDANNLGFRRLGRNLIIMAAEKLAPPPEMPEAITYSVAFGTAKSIADAIRAAVPGIRVTNEDRINAVVVTGTKAQHEEVRKVMTSLDVQLLNYSVEARVVDINKQDLQQLGLNWGLTGAPFVGVVGTTNPFAQVTVDVNFNIRATLDALVTQRRARVISAPRIGVLDGNEASVNLGEEIPIPSIDASGRLTFTFRPVGVNLRILPRANRDNLITVRLEPEVSTVREFLPTPSGPVPRLTTRKAATTITVRNGQSIIIGGLIAAEERRTTIKVPLLGDIPIIGALFRTTTTDRQETEVIFVVTPQILPSGDR